jgi:hypothetical protein
MTRPPVKTYFLVHEVEHFTGFSRYMLDYLAREEIFVASMSPRDQRGVKRRYSYGDVVLLRALYAICKTNGKIRHLKESLLRFRMAVGPIRPGMRLGQLLFVEGDELCLRAPGEGVRVLRTGQMMLTSVVDLDAVTAEIADGVIVESQEAFRLTAAAEAEVERIRQRHWGKVKQWREDRVQRASLARTKAA